MYKSRRIESVNHSNSDYSRINMAQDLRKSKVNNPTSIYYQHQPLMKDCTTQTPPGYKARGTVSEYHCTSSRQGLNMDSTMAMCIYYHFTSLKKLLSCDEIQQMKPLEDALKSQGKLNRPFGQCYYCNENTHWASDCLKLKMAREQSKTTDKPDYGKAARNLLKLNFAKIPIVSVCGEAQNTMLYRV